ncbi:MAG: D-glycero-beta-D-manno-heptose 1-phosphate adenylyltransferase [Syntrophobacterales bacterium CG_4_8_14_3_um_filter_49_14]|nr:MAG: D-glycero-beta-D-manno-heptose 1-phosphate adenylyltransferase [Syntrophobacterales bacterium CG23_combo_of_CG06-09_8_20_14_all_48_27]PJA47732.1 MAG: D-glycero-beta-D-manno-heptose 1-phosphate adenylyltransferase [Syntrophobacterales bacterium CG_4_9_14_3_um_filter_49_8]PJC72881.1 MAG: D-glycero-beta-D-manno-heptose 1-phosphate adenylyltransferase [Syntrophobacterales bacterium CG_4_8_14_3_um_filter_49_14]
MNKIYSREKLKEELDRLRKEGKKTIFTNGCFDILHVGHARYLQEAKKIGDILVVAINSDSSVRAIKGEKRPIIPEDERAEMVASLGSVDYVTIFHESTPLELIEYLQPHVIVKGGDWTEEKVVGRESVKKLGGTVVIVPEIRGASTSGIIEKITKIYSKE